ncbi:MAG: hypothetical protein WCY62_07995 [Clostridia bacterium]
MKDHSIARKLLIIFTVMLSGAAVLMLYALVSLFQKYDVTDNETYISDTPVNTETFSYETLITVNEICTAVEAADINIKDIDTDINDDGTICFSWTDTDISSTEGFNELPSLLQYVIKKLPYAKLSCTMTFIYLGVNEIETIITDAVIAGFTIDPSHLLYIASDVTDALEQKILSVENFVCEAISVSEKGVELKGHLDITATYNFTNTTDLVLTVKFLRNLEVLDSFNNVRKGDTITFDCEITDNVITCKCWYLNTVITRVDLDPDVYIDGWTYDIVSYENSYGLSYTLLPAEAEQQ